MGEVEVGEDLLEDSETEKHPLQFNLSRSNTGQHHLVKKSRTLCTAGTRGIRVSGHCDPDPDSLIWIGALHV